MKKKDVIQKKGYAAKNKAEFNGNNSVIKELTMNLSTLKNLIYSVFLILLVCIPLLLSYFLFKLMLS